MVSKFRKAVLCFQESKVDDVSRSFLRSFVGSFFDKYYFIPSVGSAGGIITCWNSKAFSCGEVLVRKYSLTTQMKHLSSGSTFYVTNVYRPPSWDGKEEFCNELAALKEVCGGSWVMCGDFNLIKNTNERRGKTWCGRLMTLFMDLLINLGMIDLPLGNQNFTWSNMQSRPTLAKLDHFLISTK